MRRPDEFESPSCAQIGGDFWFPEKESNTRDIALAKSICGGCLHRTECAEWGIKNERFGIWGGLSENARTRIRNQRSRNIRGSEVA